MRYFVLVRYLVLTLGLALLASPAPAAEVDGTKFSKTYVADGRILKLTGAGLMRYWGFKVKTGALYLEAGASLDEVLSDRAKRLEIEYLRAIKGEDFGPATAKLIAKNVAASTFDRLRPQIEYHSSLYEDVQPGDRYALTYIPGRGTELTLNGESKGIVAGREFAAAIFSIWLGPEPINESFKNQILGL